MDLEGGGGEVSQEEMEETEAMEAMEAMGGVEEEEEEEEEEDNREPETGSVQTRESGICDFNSSTGVWTFIKKMSTLHKDQSFYYMISYTLFIIHNTT